MKVSIIIPTYNRAHFITCAIDSALSQTFTDFEIIVVDDGSTDGTAELLRSRYGDKIVYLRQERQGPAAARNAGMLIARGEYISFLDSDDLYYPYKLEMQVQLLDVFTDLAMFYTEFSAFDDHGFFEEFHLRQYHKSAYRNRELRYETLFQRSHRLAAYDVVPEQYRNRFFFTGSIYAAYLLHTLIFTNSMMFRRDILAVTGLQNTTFKFFEELEFARRICRHYQVGFVDIPTYKLRYHPYQVSSTDQPGGQKIAIRKQQCLLRALKLHLASDPEHYHSCQAILDRQLARLYRAVAIPMITYDGPSEHARRYYPRRARVYLAKCKAFGRPEYFLYTLTYLPPLPRRIVFKLNDMTRRYLKVLRP
jgi:glycosyltransferase involved in cell wall biosynthesis